MVLIILYLFGYELYVIISSIIQGEHEEKLVAVKNQNNNNNIVRFPKQSHIFFQNVMF